MNNTSLLKYLYYVSTTHRRMCKIYQNLEKFNNQTDKDKLLKYLRKIHEDIATLTDISSYLRIHYRNNLAYGNLIQNIRDATLVVALETTDYYLHYNKIDR